MKQVDKIGCLVGKSVKEVLTVATSGKIRSITFKFKDGTSFQLQAKRDYVRISGVIR